MCSFKNNLQNRKKKLKKQSFRLIISCLLFFLQQQSKARKTKPLVVDEHKTSVCFVSHFQYVHVLYRVGILGRNWNKNLQTFAPCYSQSLPPADFTPPYGFLGLEIYTATAESGWGFGFVSLCLPLKIALFYKTSNQ